MVRDEALAFTGAAIEKHISLFNCITLPPIVKNELVLIALPQ